MACADPINKPCKDVQSKIRIYLKHSKGKSFTDEERTRIHTIIPKVLGLSEFQCETIMNFAVMRGNCIIYEGEFTEGVAYATALAESHINVDISNIL